MITKAYIINLARRPDKKHHMENEFQKLKSRGEELSHEFFDAVDGHSDESLSKYNFSVPAWYDPNSGKAMTRGEVGCALSHYSVWKKIVDDVESGELPKNSKILILEDDVIFFDDFQRNFEKYTTETEFEYDMLYLHRKPLHIEEEKKLSLHINIIQKSYWNCAYVLTYSGAKKLINTNYLDNLIPVDEFIPAMYGCKIFGFEKLYEQYEKIKCYAITPSLCRLTGNAFMDSETFHSSSIKNNNVALCPSISVGDVDYVLIYIGPTLYPTSNNRTDNYERFISYCEIYGIPVTTIENNNNAIDTDLLIKHLESWPEDKLERTLITVVSVKTEDNCNVIPMAPPTEIVEKIKLQMVNQQNIIIPVSYGAGTKTLFCSYAKSAFALANNYKNIANRHLSTLLKINSFTTDYIISDNKCHLLQQLTGTSNINFNYRKSRITNSLTGSSPCMVYSHDTPSTLLLNKIENYTGNGWNEYYGYSAVPKQFDELPNVYISFRVMHNENIVNLFNLIDYPKDKLVVSIAKLGKHFTLENERDFYQKDIEIFLSTDCKYYFFINGECIINNKNVLKDLLSLDKNVVAPFLRKGNDPWTNFWGDLDDNGYYSRSFDYLNIIDSERRGCWNVPYITGSYLIKRNVLELVPKLFIENNNLDIDMQMCHNLRSKNIFMYVTNLNHYGYLSNESSIEQTSTSSEIVPRNLPVDATSEVKISDIFTRRDQWEEKYLNPEYYKNKHNLKNLPFTELCNDIYSFPLFSETFCTEIIQLSELYGKWSKGKDEHNDPRLGVGYYENVPTVDVQLFELQLEKQWKEIVFSYIAPVTKILYNNYNTKDINLAFVVKYSHDDQKSLAPHHDSSTYTVNIALNRGNGIDYEGGGCRFIRQNFILRNQPPGMCSIHAGRLTAYHEGLPVTSGIRYILVSFIN